MKRKGSYDSSHEEDYRRLKEITTASPFLTMNNRVAVAGAPRDAEERDPLSLFA